jgi:phospholipid/cholesterol/gamma-HCH transport system substrate-binding protein
MGLPNSPAEQQFLAMILGLTTGAPPAHVPDWTSFLLGPLLRGTEVTLR